MRIIASLIWKHIRLAGTAWERTDLVHESRIRCWRSAFYVKVNSAFQTKFSAQNKRIEKDTYPSRTALPNGRVDELPPRNKSQIVCAKVSAWLSDWNPTEPVAPPRLRVMILPLAWQVVISDASAEQFGRSVPGNVALSVGLHVCEGSSLMSTTRKMGQRVQSRWQDWCSANHPSQKIRSKTPLEKRRQHRPTEWIC